VAFYKYAEHLVHSDDTTFDVIYQPGNAPPHSGLYRCEGCGQEIAANAGSPLPPQNHHQHKPGQGDIRWRLLVW
jgi:hypothetical protein